MKPSLSFKAAFRPSWAALGVRRILPLSPILRPVCGSTIRLTLFPLPRGTRSAVPALRHRSRPASSTSSACFIRPAKRRSPIFTRKQEASEQNTRPTSTAVSAARTARSRRAAIPAVSARLTIPTGSKPPPASAGIGAPVGAPCTGPSDGAERAVEGAGRDRQTPAEDRGFRRRRAARRRSTRLGILDHHADDAALVLRSRARSRRPRKRP